MRTIAEMFQRRHEHTVAFDEDGIGSVDDDRLDGAVGPQPVDQSEAADLAQRQQRQPFTPVGRKIC